MEVSLDKHVTHGVLEGFISAAIWLSTIQHLIDTVLVRLFFHKLFSWNKFNYPVARFILEVEGQELFRC